MSDVLMQPTGYKSRICNPITRINVVDTGCTCGSGSRPSVVGISSERLTAWFQCKYSLKSYSSTRREAITQTYLTAKANVDKQSELWITTFECELTYYDDAPFVRTTTQESYAMIRINFGLLVNWGDQLIIPLELFLTTGIGQNLGRSQWHLKECPHVTVNYAVLYLQYILFELLTFKGTWDPGYISVSAAMFVWRMVKPPIGHNFYRWLTTYTWLRAVFHLWLHRGTAKCIMCATRAILNHQSLTPLHHCAVAYIHWSDRCEARCVVHDLGPFSEI